MGAGVGRRAWRRVGVGAVTPARLGNRGTAGGTNLAHDAAHDTAHDRPSRCAADGSRAHTG